MSQASTAPHSSAAAAPAAAPLPSLTVDPRRLSLNPPTPSPRPQELARRPGEQPAPTASATTSPEPEPRPDRSPLFRPLSTLANRPSASASTSTAPSLARPQPTPVGASGLKGAVDDDDDVDQLADDELEPDKPPVASTSKAAAPSSSSSLAPPAKRYAGNVVPSSHPKKRHRISTVGSADRSTGYRPPPLPHYTVVRSPRNSALSPHIIRIHDNVTDGSRARWPDASERDPGHKVAGRENWYECPPADVGRHQMFRDKLGEELAKKLGLSDDDPTAHWAVENLPQHHLFTVHHCVTSSNHPRQDVYIFGPSSLSLLLPLSELVLTRRTLSSRVQARRRRTSSAPSTSSSRTCTGSSCSVRATACAASASTAPRRASRTSTASSASPTAARRPS